MFIIETPVPNPQTFTKKIDYLYLNIYKDYLSSIQK